ncbi:MAG: imidazoleglycerol-phosphate dehydratase [Microbacterium sp.]|jgi:imidazoleglycerol-phosphate dehydratase|nr:imidazoleglycerol-phosphate dehydratase [Microbacterium sp.]
MSTESATPRTAEVRRATSESQVELSLDLDGDGTSSIDTSVPFFDHMLTAFAKHSLTNLTVRATGDTHIDAHHTVEDVAIVLGQAIRQALGDKAGISRYGDALVPLDEALAQAVVDISGRPYLVHTGEPVGYEHHLIGGHFTGALVRHVFEAIAFNAGLTVHVRVLEGRDPHHIAEAEFKAFARAFRQAKALDPLVTGVPSTKGAL